MPGVYFEFTVQGAYVKVAAIDAESGFEVSIVGPVGTPQPELERLALRKLDYVSKKSVSRNAKENGPGKL